MQKQNLGKFKEVFSLAVFGVMAMVGMFGLQGTVLAANLNADQVLGQVNSDGTQNFTNILTNSTPEIKNDHGFDFSFEFAVFPDTTVDTDHHRLFVSDSYNNRVLIFDLDNNNNLIDYKADKVLGQENFVGGKANRGGLVGAATLNHPGSLVYDAAHDYLFVMDTLNSRILVFNLADGITNGEEAIQVIGQVNFTNYGGRTPVAADTLNMPYGMVLDAARELLFVADSGNNRVLVFNLADGITDGIDGGEMAFRVLGQTDFEGTAAGDITSTTLSNPYAIDYSSAQKLLFVSDSNRSRVLVYDLADGPVFADGITNGEPAIHVLGQVNFTDGAGGITANKIQYAGGVSVDDVNNHLFVSDPNAHRVLVYDIANIVDGADAVNVIGQLDFTHNSSGTGATRFNLPRNVHYSDNKLYVVDNLNHRVLEFNTVALNNFLPAQTVLGQLNSGTPDFEQNLINSGAVNEYGFNRPLGITKDEVDHKLFVADAFNNRVLVFNLDNNNDLVDYQADAVLGQADFSGNVANRNSLVAANTLSFPTDVEFDSTENLLLVSDQHNNRIVAYNLADGITNGEDAIKVIGQADFDHNDANRGGAVNAGTLQSPRGMDINSDGSILYAVDANNHRVLAYNLADGIDSGIETAVHVLGQSDLNGRLLNGADGVPASSTMFSPNDVLFDSVANRLFISEGGNHRVLVYNLVDGITDGESAVGVLGQSDFEHNSANRGGGVAANTVNSPYGMAINPSGKILYVSDSTNNRVLAYNLTDGIVNGEDAMEVIGSSDFVGNANAPVRAKLNFPTFLIYNNAHSSLSVSDLMDHRVVTFNLLTLPQKNLADAAFGVAYDQTITLAINSRGTVQYSIVSGALPGGLSLDNVTGKISGTPSVTGNFIFVVKAADTFLDDNGLSNTFSAYQTYTLAIPASFHLPPTVLAAGTVGTAFNKTINAAADSEGIVTYAVTAGNLPNGLAFDAATRVISGTPTSAGTFNFTITATDTVAVGVEHIDSEDFSIVINPAPVAPPVGGGGGGGGGGSPAFNAPVGGFSVTVDSVVAETNPAQVNLKLNGGTAVRMAIANTPDFAGVGQELYRTSTVFALSAGNGVKTIYARFFDSFGTASIVVTTSVTITTTPNALPIIPEVLGIKITRLDELVAKLKAGQTNVEVMEMQTELKKLGYFAKTWKPTKFYGTMTKAAVKKYLADKNKAPVVAKTLDELVAMLKLGQKSDLVRQLQAELKKLKFLPANHVVTNYYGVATKAAVAKYFASKQ